VKRIHPKRVMFGFAAEIAKALAHPARVELLDLLAQGSRSVDSAAKAASLSVANASQHLQQLKQAGLLSAQRVGKQTVYQLADESVVEVLRTVSGFADRHLADAERAIATLYRARDPIAPVSSAELLKRIKEGTGLTIDVRPALEYRAAHIPHAINMPVDDIAKHIADIPPASDIVTYCRGPYCVFAYQAIEVLRPAGRQARRLQGGFLEWRLNRLPLEGDEVPGVL
jgi:rhodanese-related sulfurtransferase/DNA-binding transcriptional ArsR family regulator